jgi:hypothetical protein
MQAVEAVPTKRNLSPELIEAIRKNVKELQYLPVEYIEKLIPSLSLSNLTQQALDTWSSVDFLVRDIDGQIKTYISMSNPWTNLIKPLRPNPDFFSAIETKFFRHSINLTTGNIHISNRGRDLPRQYYRTERLRRDETENLLALYLAKHYAEREPEQLRIAHARRDRFPKTFRPTRKMRRKGREFLKLIMAGKREAREREAGK